MGEVGSSRGAVVLNPEVKTRGRNSERRRREIIASVLDLSRD